ncbi:putative integrase [Mycobacterium tuberculosis H37Ra]|nr:putative integrase [Mycobacterium tuberculosis H37Ra]
MGIRQRRRPGRDRRLVPHGLGHTTASLAISAGANVKVVQRLLGHAAAAMTLDRHGHLLNDDLAVWPMRCAKSSRTLRYHCGMRRRNRVGLRA